MTLIFFLFIACYSLLYVFLFQSLWFIPISIVLAIFSSIISIILIVIISVPFCIMTKPSNRLKFYYFRSMIRLGNLFVGFSYQIVGKENIPTKGSYVIVANHKSYCDIMAIFSIAKTPIGFVSKPGVFKVPLLGTFMKSFGCIGMHRDDDREGARDMVRAIKQVKSGLPMCIFPEGGRLSLTDEKMISYRAGAFKLATKAEVDIIPISLIGTTKIKDGAPWTHRTIKIVVHKPMTSEYYDNLNTHQIGDEILQTINSVIEEPLN